MQKRTKTVVAGAALAVLVVVGVAAAAKGRNKAVDVKIEQVQRRDLVAAVTASGQVQAHTKVDISPDITGRVVRVGVKDGEQVTKGQFLLQIDPSQYQAAVERAAAGVASNRAQLEQASANMAQAQRAFDRTAELKRRNPTLVSNEQMDQLKTTVDVNHALVDASRHGVDQASAGLRDAQSSLSKTTILAPMSGKITRLNIHEGETATPGTFSKDIGTLLTISDMSSLETKVKVDETDVSHIKVGDSAVVQLDAMPDTTFMGRVSEISNSSLKQAATGNATDQAVDYEVTVQLLNPPPQTRPDFSATAKIVTDARRNVLTVPIIALTVREDTPVGGGDQSLSQGKAQPKKVGQRDAEGVFVVDPNTNKVTFRPVKVGITGEKYFEVVNGVKPGESIVAGTYQAIKDLKDGTVVHNAVADAKKSGGKS